MSDQTLYYVVRVGETWAVWEMTSEAMAERVEKDSTSWREPKAQTVCQTWEDFSGNQRRLEIQSGLGRAMTGFFPR